MHRTPGTPAPCAVCGKDRSVHDAARGVTCAEWRCKAEQVKRIKAAEAAAFLEKCNEIAQDFAERTGIEAIPARVPRMSRPVVPTPPEDVALFRQNLREAFRETARRAAEGQATPIEEKEDISNPVLDASCITCRGWCCRQGYAHAFLKPEFLPTVLARRPKDNPADIYRDYLRRIPEESMQDACLYQGEQGCVLPRHMRSFVCNDFECRERIDMKMALEDQPDASAVVIAMEGDEVKAATIARPGKPLEWVET